MRAISSFFLFVWEILKIVIVALLIVLPIRYFLFQPFIVRGQSMEPNFENGDYLIIDEISYRFREPQRGEVIVFQYPYNHSQRYIKRIIGLPGELIEVKDERVIVENQVLNEEEYLPFGMTMSGNVRFLLKEDEYFVLGDNRGFSSDSRQWGPLKQANIIGRVYFRAWPVTAMAKIEVPAY